MKIFITGGTGFVGYFLTEGFAREGHSVTVLTRNPSKITPAKGVIYQEGNPLKPGKWQVVVPEHDVVFNLAGSSIFRRWTGSVKKNLRESRILTTNNLVDALKDSEKKTTALINTSAVGFYGFHDNEEIDENSPAGDDFLAELSRDWEKAALSAKNFGIRVLVLRYGVVLGNGGALSRMLPLYKKYLGSPLGSGKQWFSWIHLKDLFNIYRFLIDKPDMEGAFNCTTPFPITNREMTKIIGEVLGKPAFMPSVPSLVMKIALGEFSSTLLKGQKVIPERLLKEGFGFEFPEMREALQDILGKGEVP